MYETSRGCEKIIKGNMCEAERLEAKKFFYGIVKLSSCYICDKDLCNSVIRKRYWGPSICFIQDMFYMCSRNLLPLYYKYYWTTDFRIESDCDLKVRSTLFNFFIILFLYLLLLIAQISHIKQKIQPFSIY